jgi:DnaK suppressor protein
MTNDELLAMPDDAYMNDAQQTHFCDLLNSQRSELQARIDMQFTDLKQPDVSGDPADIGSAEEQQQWQLRLLEREKVLLDKIDDALDRLAHGRYGWCEETGEPIGLRRLLLRPTATLSIEAKKIQEQRERHVRNK